MNILLGVTGSVAATLTGKLANALITLGKEYTPDAPKHKVRIVVTKSAEPFIEDDLENKCHLELEHPSGGHIEQLKSTVFSDDHEWRWPGSIETNCSYRRKYQKNDKVLHIELRKWADVLVIAPLSANTLAKMTYGLCDNLLTSIYRAWDWRKPVIVAPSMNTMMWENDPTSDQLRKLRNRSVIVVPPMEKELACGDIGEGAMALIDDIVKATKEELFWHFPLKKYRGIPINNHPGAFGFRRKRCHHSGVDLYTDEGADIFAVEAGKVVGIEHFTGPQDSTPWYENTEAILIEGKTGVVCYGEMIPRGYNPTSFASAMNRIAVGDWVKKGGYIGRVTPVIPVGREQAYPGWSRSMLHLELYKHGTHECSHRWHLDAEMHPYLIDPTPFLREALAITGVDESSYLLNYDG